MDTLYTLCRSADNRHALPLSDEACAEVMLRKRAFFTDEATQNPLVDEILKGGRIRAHEMERFDRHGFGDGPATFFRAHELLRWTRSANVPLLIGEREFSHTAVAEMFSRCVPNAKLQHIPWFSMARYSTSLALAWGGTALVAHLFARENGGETVFDRMVLSRLGLLATAVAVVTSALKANRDPRHAAPWNSAMYLDINAQLLRRNSTALGLARKEFVPNQRPFKKPAFYYALARDVEATGYEAQLRARAISPATAST
ncbi:MAG: hypothetical protein U1F61_07095 [Opitutaceae bacterium]